MVLEEQVKVGHELWLTSFGFVAGVAWGAHRPRPHAGWMLLLTLGLWGALLALNLVGMKGLNTFLIAAGALAVAIWLTVAELPLAAARLDCKARQVLARDFPGSHVPVHPPDRQWSAELRSLLSPDPCSCDHARLDRGPLVRAPVRPHSRRLIRPLAGQDAEPYSVLLEHQGRSCFGRRPIAAAADLADSVVA